MRARRPLAALCCSTALALTALLTPAVPAQAARYSPTDPTTWTNAQLAAQVTFGCVQADDAKAMVAEARAGYGGITLLGNNASSDLAAQLRSVRAAAPHGVAPFVASDEEGGRVQRLARLIYKVPAAKYMGAHWGSASIRKESTDYGKRMRRLGVLMEFGPVADLAIPGYYIDQYQRGFSQDPRRVEGDVNAWVTGMRSAGLVPVVKHWPGHGQATNSHTGPASVPDLPVLEKRDMVPFDDEFRRGVPAVMVGHLMSKGLTEPGLPASESPHALAYLRSKTGPHTLIVTDSLSMAAASKALHRSVASAAVAALKAGADVALACESGGVVAGITRNLDNGYLKRDDVVAKVRRLLALKKQAGLLPH